MLQLIVNRNLPGEGLFDVRDGHTIGRVEENDIYVAEPSLSRHHARLEVRGNVVTIIDLGSKNGTWVNGDRIERRELHGGDVIRCGEVRFSVMERTSQQMAPMPQMERDPLLDYTHVPMEDLLSSQPTGGSSSALRVRTNDHEGRDKDKLRILLRVSELLGSPGSIDALLDKVLSLVFQILDVDRAAILLVNPVSGQLEPRVVKAVRGHVDGDRIYSEHIVDYVRQKSVAALFSDARDDPRLGVAKSIFNQSIRASMCAPLKPKDDVIGVLYVDNLGAANRFSEEDLEFLVAFANQAAISIENSRLHQRIESDAVTRNNFLRFFPPATIKRILDSPEPMLGVIETEITALFCDISGFTELSSRMRPLEVVNLLNEYFPVVADVVFRHEGTLEKYIGDALMAVWGAPFAHDDDMDRALAAAVEMQELVRDLNAGWPADRQLNIHIGLNTGRAAAGNIGSDRYLQYATIGDATNIASRICAVALPDEIIISRATLQGLKTRTWPIEPMEPVYVKGKTAPLELYKVLWQK